MSLFGYCPDTAQIAYDLRHITLHGRPVCTRILRHDLVGYRLFGGIGSQAVNDERGSLKLCL